MKCFLTYQFLSQFFFEIYSLEKLKRKKNNTANADKEFGDCYFDILENCKILVRATLKTYDQTITYVFLKVFKKAIDSAEFECVQQLSLTNEKFSKLLKSGK